MNFPDSTEPRASARCGRGPTPPRVGPRPSPHRTRSRRPAGRAPLLATLALLAGTASLAALAAGGRGGNRVEMPLDLGFGEPLGILQLEPRLDIGRVMPGEILGGGGSRAIPLGRWEPGAAPEAAFEIDTQITRSLPAVWRMRVRDLDAMQAVNVRLRIDGPDGAANALGAADDPHSLIRARIVPTPPVVVAREADSLVIEGGALLQLDLRDVRAAGPHVGTLTVTLESY